MLCIFVIVCMCICLLDICYMLYVCWAGLDVGWGPITGRGPLYVIMYVILSFGELTKLCVYGFPFMFQVLLVPRGRTWVDCIAHTIWIPLLRYHSDCYDVLYTYFLSCCMDNVFGILFYLN